MKRDMTMKDMERMEREDARAKEQKMARYGQILFDQAMALGWKESDSEGPLEYVTRLAYETGWGDRAPSDQSPT